MVGGVVVESVAGSRLIRPKRRSKGAGGVVTNGREYVLRHRHSLDVAIEEIRSSSATRQEQIKIAMKRAGIAVADPDLRIFVGLLKRWIPSEDKVLAVYTHFRQRYDNELVEGPWVPPKRSGSQTLHVVLTQTGYAYRSKLSREPLVETWVDGNLEFVAGASWLQSPAFGNIMISSYSRYSDYGDALRSQLNSPTGHFGGFDIGDPAPTQELYCTGRDGIPVQLESCNQLTLFALWRATTPGRTVIEDLNIDIGDPKSGTTPKQDVTANPVSSSADSGRVPLINALVLLHAQGVLTDDEFATKVAHVARISK